ncbi:MAG TPA: hypothetical protein VJA21_13410 [Verrucomicrobiae bacterium]
MICKFPRLPDCLAWPFYTVAARNIFLPILRLFAALMLFAGLFTVPAGAGSAATNQPTVILVVGAAGEPDFSSNFVRQVEHWTNACDRGHAKTICLGLVDNPRGSDHDRLKESLTSQPTENGDPLWLVFIGHGTFDGKEARFNLRGPDVTAAELRDWLQPFRRPLVFIDTTSASAPFLNQLSATNRVIVTATRSGNEQNFARFGLCFADALVNGDSDLDKDGQTSVLEAFLSASTHVAEFYKTGGRLATEHALIDDNGEGLGTPADWFRGVRPIKKPEGSAAVDGARAHQLHLVLSQAEQELPAGIRTKRDALELSIARLRETKAQRSEEEYYRELETLLIQLQQVYGSNL